LHFSPRVLPSPARSWSGTAKRLGWAEILFFGTGAIVFGLLLLPGSAYLKLDPAGFTFCSLFRPHFTRWSEVDSFAVGMVGTRRLVVFNFNEMHRGKNYLRKVARRFPATKPRFLIRTG